MEIYAFGGTFNIDDELIMYREYLNKEIDVQVLVIEAGELGNLDTGEKLPIYAHIVVTKNILTMYELCPDKDMAIKLTKEYIATASTISITRH